MNAPKLRFKEFNDEWSTENLSKVVTFSKGNSLSKSDLDESGPYPCILYGELYTKYHEVIRKVFSKTNHNSGNVVKSKYGDILIPASGETPVDISTASCLLLDNVLLGGDINILSPKNCDGRFISYVISNNKRKSIARVAQGHSIVHLYSENLKKIKLDIPSLKEQKKIADMLELLDKKIELQIKKIEALKLFKSYTKSEIFKNGNHVCKLGAILNKWNKKNKDGAINYVESISNKAGFIPQSEQFEDRNVASKNLRNYYVIKKGVFGYNPSRLNVGSLALKENDFISVVSPLYECFTTTQNNTYLFEWFNSNNFKKETFSKFEGGVRNTLNFNNLCDIPINLPDIETQNQYAKYFNKINFKISLEEQKLSELVKFKKGLLQDMFI